MGGTTGCVACAGTAVRPLFDKLSHRYVQCPVCHAGRLDPLPDPHTAAALYDHSYFTEGAHSGYPDYAGDEPLHRANARRRLSLLRRTRRPPGLLVDVGCALGFFLDEARREGWTVRGVEPSPHAASWAVRHLALEVVADIEALAAGSPTAVTLFQVLEHVPRPDQLLRAVAERLAPGGVVMIETWDRESLVARLLGRHWQQVSPPSVIHLFSRPSLRELLRRAGLDPVWIGATGKRVSVSHVASLLAGKYALARKLGAARIPAAVGRLGISYRLGDLITVLARRR